VPPVKKNFLFSRVRYAGQPPAAISFNCKKQQMITRKLLTSGLAVLILAGCGNKTAQPKETVTPVDSVVTTTPVRDSVTTGLVQLVCKNIGEDSLGTPHFDVFLLAEGKETKINSINGCAEITRADYPRYEIPQEAISACGGWWAGAGDYYYVIMEAGKPAVYEGWQEEGQPDNGYHWKKITVR